MDVRKRMLVGAMGLATVACQTDYNNRTAEFRKPFNGYDVTVKDKYENGALAESWVMMEAIDPKSDTIIGTLTQNQGSITQLIVKNRNGTGCYAGTANIHVRRHFPPCTPSEIDSYTAMLAQAAASVRSHK